MADTQLTARVPAACASQARLPQPPEWTWWDHILDLLLTFWVLRAPFGGLAMGTLILWLAPQAQDLMVELATDTYSQQFTFFALLVLVWAIPTHYASRLLLNTDDRYLERARARNTAFICWLRLFMPRLFGAATFVIVAIGVARSWSNVPIVSDAEFVGEIGVNLALVGIALTVIGALFLRYTIYRREIAACVRAFKHAIALLRSCRRGPMSSSDASGGDEPADSVLGPKLLVLMTFVLIGGPLIWPLPFADAFPRSAAVPFVIGAWIPLLSFLASKGRKRRFPLIATAFVIITIVPTWVGNNYGVRRIDAAKQVAELVPGTDPAMLKDITGDFSFNEALSRWKATNGLECVGDSKRCPRPIVIAAAGGASRAGFFTASVIGQLLDDTLKVNGVGHGLSAADVNKRLFAVSGVSGSSVGAVMAVAALAVSKDGEQPCRPKSFVLWFGSSRGLQIENWRSCLEALMAGDFLTPVFDGFVFRDMLRIIHYILPGWSDRATLIERAWENHFAALIGKPESSAVEFRCSRSLSCPFMTLRPIGDRWIPLLVINGTSVGTGRRIMTTPLAWHYEARTGVQCPLEPRDPVCQLFLDTQLFHGLLVSNDATKFNDIRISTAAHNSARFPIISPPGEIFNNSEIIVDRIVDGGYFENFGAYAAGEIVQALRAVDANLNPFVLVLSNDPQVPAIDPKVGLQPAAAQPGQMKAGRPKTPPAGQEGSFLTDASGPIAAIMNARNAHGIVAVDGLTSLLDQNRFNGPCNVVTLKVWGEPVSAGEPDKLRQLSMSWWLSKPVQMYLHEQTDFTNAQRRNSGNLGAAQAILTAMRASSADTSGSQECPR